GQGVDVAGRRAPVAVEQPGAADFTEHSLGFSKVDGWKAQSHVFEDFDEESTQTADDDWPQLLVIAHAYDHLDARCHHFLNQKAVDGCWRMGLRHFGDDAVEGRGPLVI